MKYISCILFLFLITSCVNNEPKPEKQKFCYHISVTYLNGDKENLTCCGFQEPYIDSYQVPTPCLKIQENYKKDVLILSKVICCGVRKFKVDSVYKDQKK